MEEGQLLIAMLISFIKIEMKHLIWGFLMSNNRVSEVVTLIMNTFAKKFAHNVYCLCCHWPGPATRAWLLSLQLDVVRVYLLSGEIKVTTSSIGPLNSMKSLIPVFIACFCELSTSLAIFRVCTSAPVFKTCTIVSGGAIGEPIL